MFRQTNPTTLEMPPIETIRHYCDSLLTEPPNRCISDFAIALSKFFASLGISDIPKSLNEIGQEGESKS